MTLRPDDYEVVRAGSSAYPWAVRHCHTGELLPYPATVKTWDVEVTTTLLFHRRKKDAVAALTSMCEKSSGGGGP